MSQNSCSFCGLRESEVSQLLVGPNVFICTDCTLTAFGALIKNSPSNPELQTELSKAMEDLSKLLLSMTDDNIEQ